MLQSTGQGESRAWKVYQNGQEYGPYTREEVEAYLLSGEIPGSALLLGPGMADWQRADGASSAPEAAAPVPTYAAAPSYAYQRSPDYIWLRITAGLMAGFGILMVAFGVFALVAATATKPSKAMDDYGISEYRQAALLLQGFTVVASGIGLIFMGAIGMAIRDIARNSFRR